MTTEDRSIATSAISGTSVAHETVHDHGNPEFYSVSVPKLFVLSLCTLGLYELYIQYRNWALIKARDNSDIKPFWRAFFAIFFVYGLFSRVDQSARNHQLPGTAAGPLAAGWIITTLLWRLPDPYWLICYAAVFFLLPVQSAINRINSATCTNLDTNGRYNGWEVALVVVGGLFFVLAVIGTFLPE